MKIGIFLWSKIMEKNKSAQFESSYSYENKNRSSEKNYQ